MHGAWQTIGKELFFQIGGVVLVLAPKAVGSTNVFTQIGFLCGQKNLGTILSSRYSRCHTGCGSTYNNYIHMVNDWQLSFGLKAKIRCVFCFLLRECFEPAQAQKGSTSSGMVYKISTFHWFSFKV